MNFRRKQAECYSLNPIIIFSNTFSHSLAKASYSLNSMTKMTFLFEKMVSSIFS